MDIQIRVVLAAALAYGVSAVLTPLTMRLASRIGAVDIPRDGRRLHTKATPRAGGIAIFVAFMVAVGLIGRGEPAFIRFLLGAQALVLLGILDDVFRLPALPKLAVQMLACALAVGRGGWQGMISAVWLLALVNAHNMIDGMDGLSASVSAVEGFLLAVLLALQGDAFSSGIALVLCACALGYLPYNRHPARVFMGDAGSQFLGVSLGYVSLSIDVHSAGQLGWMVAPLVFALPLSDLIFAVLRRFLRGQSPFAADRGHWHHRLVDTGMGQRRALFWLVLFCALLGVAGVLVSREGWYGMAVYALLWTACAVMALETLYGSREDGGNV